MILPGHFRSSSAAVVASDDFNRADGPVSNGWTVATGTDFRVISNQLRNLGSSAAAYKGPSVSSGEVSGELGPYAGLVFGLTDTDNYFLLFRFKPDGGSEVVILQIASGAVTLNITIGVDTAPMTAYSVQFSGSSVIVKQSGTTIYTSSLSGLGPGFCGVNISDTTTPLDNWRLTA